MTKLSISEAQLNQAVKNANIAIAFEDEEIRKQYFRGVRDTLKNLLEKVTK